MANADRESKSAPPDPIFLVGCERSGTTLLRLMLDSHPLLSFRFESEYIVSEISEDGDYPDMDDYLRYLRNVRSFKASGLEIDSSLDYLSLINSFFEQQKKNKQATHVGTTVHYDFRKISRIWPTARYIYLFRDPRDVARSIVQMGWAGNCFVASDWWDAAEVEWHQLKNTLDESTWIEVQFEKLIQNPEDELGRICAFIDIPYTRKMLNYPEYTSYGPPDDGLIYQWASRPNIRDVSQVERKLLVGLNRRGYQLSGYRLKCLCRFTRVWYLHSKLKTFRFRIKRYGILLTVQALLGRLFRSDAMTQSAKVRMDNITEGYLK